MKLLLQLLGALTLAGMIVGAVGLLLAGTWLRVDDDPVKADAIIVLGGSYARAFHAADLYNKGLAPLVYVSRVYRSRDAQLVDSLDIPLSREEVVNRDILLKMGVPTKAVRFFGQESVSTTEEAQALVETLGPGIQRLLIVTSGYHGRRTKIIFEDLMPYRELHVLPTPYDPFPRQWWQEKDAARQTLLECFKLAYYLLGGRYLSSSESLGKMPEIQREPLPSLS